MIIIIEFLLLITLCRLLFFEKKYNNFFIIFTGILLLIISSSRVFELGTDLDQYIGRFLNFPLKEYSEILQSGVDGSFKDLMFYLFSKILSNIGISVRGYISILSAIFLFTVFRLIKKYSSLPLLSIILFISLGYLFFSFTGLRQAMAMAFTISSLIHLKEKRINAFVLLVLIGSLFHSSALIFLIVYPISKIKFNKIQFLILGLGFFITIFFDGLIRQLIQIFAWNETLASYADQDIALSYSGFIIQLSVYLFCLYYKDKLISQNQSNIILYNVLFLGLFFQIFAVVIAEFFRISMYFSIFSIVLVPMAIQSENRKMTRIGLYTVISTALLIYIIISNQASGFNLYWL